MSTPKKHITLGNKVKVTNKGKGKHSPVTLTLTPGDWADGHYDPPVDSILEIIENPRKTGGFNTVKVKFLEKEFYTWYCVLRYSTDPI